MTQSDEILLSEYGRASSQPAPVNRMMAAFASDFRPGLDINLGVGYVNEQTIPADEIQQALGEVLQAPDKHPMPFNYGGPTGSGNLIASIRRFLAENRIGGLTHAALSDLAIIIGSNGASSLLESLAYILTRGIVVTSDPMYYIYTNFLERRGFELLAVPEDEQGIRTDLLAAKLSGLGDPADKISFFYIVTVNNPSCAILSNSRRRELVQIAGQLSRRCGRKIPIFFDRAYEELIHDPEVEKPRSSLLDDPDGLVYEVGTLSKVLAPGLRIGYMIGRDGPFLRAMVQRTSDDGFSAPLITQEISSWLLDNRIARQLELVRAGYREKALAVGAWLREDLGDDLESVSGGKAGFYFYLTFRTIETHEASHFFRFLTRTTGQRVIDGPTSARKPRVIYIPGQYCAHPNGQLAQRRMRQLRLSYGFEELPGIRNAIRLMRQAVDYAKRAH